MKRAKGEWPERHARFSLPESFFKGTLQRGVPHWRAARMFEQEPARDDGLKKMGIRIPIFETRVSDQIIERVPQSPRKNDEGTA
jgi:hypothetical protein